MENKQFGHKIQQIINKVKANNLRDIRLILKDMKTCDYKDRTEELYTGGIDSIRVRK